VTELQHRVVSAQSDVRQSPRHSALAATSFGPAKWLLALFFGLDVALLLYGRSMPQDSWISAIDWLGADTLMFGPLLAGVAAWYAWRDKSRLQDFVAISARRRTIAPWAAVTALLLAGGVAHIVVQAVSVAITLTRFSTVPPPSVLWLLIEPLGGYALYVGFGYVCGAVVPRIGTSLFAAMAVFLLPMIRWDGAVPRLLWEHGGGTGVSPDLTPRGTVVTAQIALGISVCVLATLIRVGPLSRRMKILAAGAATVTLLSTAFLFSTTDSRFTQDATPLATSCAKGTPTVCVSQTQSKALPALEAQTSRLDAAIRDVGFDWGVTRIEQQSPGAYAATASSTPISTRLFFLSDALSGDKADISVIMDQLLIPTPCRASDKVQQLEASDSVQAVLDWFVMKALAIPSEQSGSDFAKRLAKLEPTARGAWLSTNLAAMSKCDASQTTAIP